MQTIAERLKIARDIRDVSQANLAKTIGVSRGVIYNIENQLSIPQEIVLNAICDALDIQYEWLVDGTGEMEQSSERRALLAELEEIASSMSDTEIGFLLDILHSMKERDIKSGR